MTRTTPTLPPELTDMIIDFLYDDVKSLLACALVSRSWLVSSRLHLFRSCTIKDPWRLEAALHTIVTTQDVSVHVRELTIVGERMLCFSLKVLKALLGDLPQLRRLSLQKVTLDANSSTHGRRAAYSHKYDVHTGLRVPTSASLEQGIPQWPLRKGPFELEELRLLECHATMVNYTELFQILGLFSSIQTLFLASRSNAWNQYNNAERRVPSWAFDPVRVAMQHLHTFDIPFPIIESLLSTFGPKNTLRTFWYDDNVPANIGVPRPFSIIEGFGRMAASLSAHQQLRTLILGPLPVLESPNGIQGALDAMHLSSLRGLETFHLRAHRLEPHLARVFAALPECVREAHFVVVVVGISRAHGEGFFNHFHEFAEALAGELARRAQMTFVLDLSVVRQNLSAEKFAAVRVEAGVSLQSLRLGAPGRVRIEHSPEGLAA